MNIFLLKSRSSHFSLHKCSKICELMGKMAKMLWKWEMMSRTNIQRKVIDFKMVFSFCFFGFRLLLSSCLESHGTFCELSASLTRFVPKLKKRGPFFTLNRPQQQKVLTFCWPKLATGKEQSFPVILVHMTNLYNNHGILKKSGYKIVHFVNRIIYNSLISNGLKKYCV